MAKNTTAGMDTHLAGEVTSLAMAVLIERTDGQKFHLTTSAENITIDIGDGDGEQVYSASEGIGRTNIESDAELNVDNLDVLGIFDNVMLTELDLRRGLFDFADFKIFVFNHQDTSIGIVKIFRGELGLVITTPLGFFKVTVRSLVQVYSKETGEHYTKDCKADLGDMRCRVPIFPEPKPVDAFDRSFPVSYIAPSIAYQLGDFVMIPATIDPDDCSQITMNFEDVDTSTGSPGIDNIGTHINPTYGGTAQIDTAQAPAGGDSTSSLLLDGNSDFASWPDSAVFTLGSNPVTISCHFRLNATGTTQVIASHYDFSSQRSWRLQVSVSDDLAFTVWQPGGVTIDITLTGTTGLTTGVDYHVAVVRKTNGDWILFLDGSIEDGPTTPTGDPHNSTGLWRIGATANSVDFFNGWIDSFEFLNGFARWDAPFTPPTGNLSVATVPLNELPWEDFADRLYEVTTPGTSGICIQTPDSTVSNTHNQGSAVLTANHSWMRFAEVTAIGLNPRREFTVTELTPNSGQAVGANRTPSALGFPDDWFIGGAAFFDTGDNAGVAKEVRDFVADDGITIEQDITMFDQFPFDVQVGDKLRIFPGCDKTNAICISKFNAGIDFVGEPYVPGEDVLGQYPDAR